MRGMEQAKEGFCRSQQVWMRSRFDLRMGPVALVHLLIIFRISTHGRVGRCILAKAFFPFQRDLLWNDASDYRHSAASYLLELFCRYPSV